VAGLANGDSGRDVVLGAYALVTTLGQTVVAEGVETTAECDSLVELGADWLQGFLFAHPDFPFPTPRI